jgi:alkanesulfonate monooxygenase SsuD/methylene tetrahydromethanopterin reductase-like flavin-dependent oxidoreductase (luciferase family)
MNVAMPEKISFAVQAAPTDTNGWVSLARKIDAMSFEALCVADHPGITSSPFLALAKVAP